MKSDKNISETNLPCKHIYVKLLNLNVNTNSNSLISPVTLNTGSFLISRKQDFGEENLNKEKLKEFFHNSNSEEDESPNSFKLQRYDTEPNNILKKISSQDKENFPLRSSNLLKSVNICLDDERLKRHFEVILKIGEGGFGKYHITKAIYIIGQVYKVRHYFDNSYYALKIIELKVGKSENLLEHEVVKEVRTMTNLIHNNVVRYCTCWFESTNSLKNGEFDSKGSSSQINLVSLSEKKEKKEKNEKKEKEQQQNEVSKFAKSKEEVRPSESEENSPKPQPINKEGKHKFIIYN